MQNPKYKENGLNRRMLKDFLKVEFSNIFWAELSNIVWVEFSSIVCAEFF